MKAVYKYIKSDFNTNPTRLIAEIYGMICGVAAAILLAATAPNPMLISCYILWLMGSLTLFICSLSRGSTGLALSYALYFIIDIVGFTRTVFL